MTLGRQKSRSKKSQVIPKSKIALYSAIFITLVAVVASGYKTPQNSSSQLNQTASLPSVANVSSESQKAPSVDKLVAADVAASLAEQANLPIAPTVASASVSLQVQTEIAQSEDDTAVSKPQIVQPTSGDRTVKTYIAKRGDTVESIAAQFNVSPNTIRWANDLESDNVKAGKKLTVLPVDGIAYTFKRGDSINEIAKRYKTEPARIISYNDLELSSPKKGQKLLIPNGVLPAAERPGYVAPSTSTSSYGNTSSDPGGSYNLMNVNLNASAGNRYAPGNCTWYAYERRAQLGRPVGSFWGDGGSWAYSASAIGYEVNHNPRAGAVLVMAGSPGHVAIVESVRKNGDIYISEMNYAGNFNRVTSRTISAGQAKAYLYIHDR
ncbi:MAG TPA: CHAP domain-containing protein [Candidatus Saccharimonadales bacterium]